MGSSAEPAFTTSIMNVGPYSQPRRGSLLMPREASTRLASIARKIANCTKPEIRISLYQPQQYLTTGSAISGTAIITSSDICAFDHVQVTLEGEVRISIDQMSQVSGQTTINARHLFLKLNMPIPESVYPVSKTLVPGSVLEIPFNFNIPSQLLPRSCTHKATDHARAEHLLLPPTMGDGIKCDLTPHTGSVAYSINVKIVRSSSEKPVVISAQSHKISVIPRVVETPPVHINESESEFQLSRAKTLRKGIFKGKLGQVIFSTRQPKPFVLDPASSSMTASMTVPLKLQFLPTEASSQPPKIGTITAKIQACTFVSIVGQSTLCRKADHMLGFEPSRGIYCARVSLATMKIDSVSGWKWTADASPRYERRDSGYSNSSEDTPLRRRIAPAARPPGFYEAIINIPLTLPLEKTWIPTFHSCLTSRIYSLEFGISVYTGTGGLPTMLNLRVPVQIASSGAGDMEMDIAESVDEALRPRMLSVPDVEFVRARLPPSPEVVRGESLPGYAGGAEAYMRRESRLSA